jgi:hypothetical protein
MRSLKIGVALVCICSLAIPAFAEDAAKSKVILKGEGVRVDNKPNAKPEEKGVKTVDGISFDTEAPADMSKVKLDRKSYMKQLEAAFDKMDANGDGTLDTKEMGQGRNAGAREEFDEDISDTMPLSKQSVPARPAKPASDGSVGIPPVNAGDLIQK